MANIDEKTRIPLFAAMSAVVVMAAVIYTLAAWGFNTLNNTKRLDGVEQKQDTYSKDLSDIKGDIRVIKEVLIKQK